MNSQTYVTDPKLWEAFYKNMAERKFNPYKYRPKQKGRGWSYQKSYSIPVQPNAFPSDDAKTEKVCEMKRSIQEHKTNENIMTKINKPLPSKAKKRKIGLLD